MSAPDLNPVDFRIGTRDCRWDPFDATLYASPSFDPVTHEIYERIFADYRGTHIPAIQAVQQAARRLGLVITDLREEDAPEEELPEGALP